MSNPNCPVCPGSGALLGALGRTRHYRCRDCGMDFNRTDRAATVETIDNPATGNHATVSRRRNSYGEFTVRFYEGGVANHDATYHTNDRDDALGTARAQLGLTQSPITA